MKVVHAPFGCATADEITGGPSSTRPEWRARTNRPHGVRPSKTVFSREPFMPPSGAPENKNLGGPRSVGAVVATERDPPSESHFQRSYSAKVAR